MPGHAGSAYHGVDQALVAIAQIGREPSWWLIEGFARPLSIREIKRREAFVFNGGIFEPVFQRISSCLSNLKAQEGSYIGILNGGAKGEECVCVKLR